MPRDLRSAAAAAAAAAAAGPAIRKDPRKSTRVTARDRMLPRSSDRSRASVRQGPSPIHGTGAFAARRIRAGALVTSMQHAAPARDGPSPGYPHDSVIHLACKGLSGLSGLGGLNGLSGLNGLAVRDVGWTSPLHKPTWYVMNHATCGANVTPRVGRIGPAGPQGPQGPQGPTIGWFALRDIEPGEELFWPYQTGRTLAF
jgi:hypothetical protein